MEPEKPDPRLRARRAALVVVIAGAIGILIGLCGITAKFEEIYIQLEMRHLPLPTEGFLLLARNIRSISGAMILAAFGIALGVAAWKGKLDRRWGKVTACTLLGTFLLIGFWVLAVALPIIKIQQALSTK